MRRLNKPFITFLFAFDCMMAGFIISDIVFEDVILKMVSLFNGGTITSEQITILYREIIPYEYIFTLPYAILFWLFGASVAKILLGIFEKPQS